MRLLYTFVFGCCFALHASSDFQKFLNGDTIFTSTMQPRKKLKYPVVTLCPQRPFNKTAMEQLGLDEDFWVFNKMGNAAFKPATSFDELMHWWNESNVRQDHFIKEVKYVSSIEVRQNKSVLQNEEEVPYEEIATWNSGRCFMYKFPYAHTQSGEEYIKIQLAHLEGMETRVFIQPTEDFKWQVGLSQFFDAPKDFNVLADHEYTVGRNFLSFNFHKTSS